MLFPNKISALPLLLLLAAPLAARATDQLVPAGSTFTCRIAQGRISSKTLAVGDPVLCTLDPVEFYGRTQLPYGSYLEGRMAAYKDPGHFVGKGWMELAFDRMIMGNRVLPINAKVISVPPYKVDNEGKIHGRGHAVRDTVEWLIPVLWPIDLALLPRRGPYPELKPETKITLELMDDVGIPDRDDRDPFPQQHTAGLIERQPPQQQQPQQVIYQTFQSAPQQQQVAQYQPQPAPQVIVQQAAPQVVYQPAPQVIVRPRYYVPPPPPYPPYRYYYPSY